MISSEFLVFTLWSLVVDLEVQLGSTLALRFLMCNEKKAKRNKQVRLWIEVRYLTAVDPLLGNIDLNNGLQQIS
jgi:hypothetical protein